MPYEKLPFTHLRAGNSDLIQERYREVNFFLNSLYEEVFKEEIPNDGVTFCPRKKISIYSPGNTACECPIISNAVTERIFSFVTCVVIKQRNMLELTEFDSIMRIKVRLHFKWLLL